MECFRDKSKCKAWRLQCAAHVSDQTVVKVKRVKTVLGNEVETVHGRVTEGYVKVFILNVIKLPQRILSRRLPKLSYILSSWFENNY